MSFVIVDFRS